jgi:glycolate oxidase
VPRSKLGEALREIGQLSQEYGIRVANVFHAGDGNLHPLIMFDSRKGEQQKAEELAGEILRLCIRLGGSITGEHGVGLEKRLYLPELYPGADFELLGNVQRAIDPHGIANPGKMLERTSG